MNIPWILGVIASIFIKYFVIDWLHKKNHGLTMEAEREEVTKLFKQSMKLWDEIDQGEDLSREEAEYKAWLHEDDAHVEFMAGLAEDMIDKQPVGPPESYMQLNDPHEEEKAKQIIKNRGLGFLDHKVNEITDERIKIEALNQSEVKEIKIPLEPKLCKICNANLIPPFDRCEYCGTYYGVPDDALPPELVREYEEGEKKFKKDNPWHDKEIIEEEDE